MIVIAWTLAALVGAVFSAWSLNDAWLDFLAMRGVDNGRQSINVHRLARESVRYGIQVAWFTVGCGVLGGVYLPVAETLVATAIALMLNTLIDVHERRVIRRVLRSVSAAPDG